MRITRTATYREDLEQILSYIARDNPTAALDIWDEIERQVERWCDFPLSGRLGRVRETRELVVAPTPFVVVYTVAEDVVVLRVLHGARRWPPAESDGS